MLRAKLLDAPQLILNEKTLSSPLVGKGLALFAYVALQEAPVPRTKLLDLLWPESNEKQARENLRSLLYSLRQVLGDYLTVTRQTVAFNRNLPYWLDVEVFAGVENIDVHQHPGMLSQVLNLFGDDFLSGIQVYNAPVFDLWLADQRRRFVDLAIAGRQQLVRFLWGENRLEEGLAANKRLLDLAPWHEDAHRMRIRLLAASGQRGAALVHYERCKAQLLEELNAPPSPETTALYEQIKAQPETFAPSATTPATAAVSTGREETRPLLRLSQGAMPSPRSFVGRADELQTLHRWLVTEECRVVSILGMGGQGKTTLAARFVKSLVDEATSAQPAFEGIIWHSLLTAPPLEEILRDWIYQLSDQQVYTLPSTLDRQLDLLIDYLTRRRFLFVLDNAESISTVAAANAPGSYAGYVHLWQLLLTREHRSSLLVTSREWFTQLRNEPQAPGIYRTLLLEGLPSEAGAALLKTHGLDGDAADFERIQHLYSGNPLALDLAAQTIDELFGGDTGAFLAEESPFLADIGAVLEQQFARLSPLEQEILTWLALEQIPVTGAELYQHLLAVPSKGVFFGALRSLLNRALIQQDGPHFSLQNVILEFVRGRLLEVLYQELTDPALMSVGAEEFEDHAIEPDFVGSATKREDESLTPLPVTQMRLNRYALSRAQAREDVRAAQDRLVVAPLARQLTQCWGGPTGLDKLIRRMLASLRQEVARGAALANGYAAGNLLNLLRQYTSQAFELELSHLTLRQVDLRSLQLHHCELRETTFDNCLFLNDVRFATALAIDPGEAWLAIGTLNGDIHIWDLESEAFSGTLQGHRQLINSLNFSPDGRTLISNSSNGMVCVWDVTTRTLRRRIQRAGDMMRKIAFSGDGRRMAYPTDTGITVCDVASGAHIAYMDAPGSAIRSVAFSADDAWLAAGNLAGQIFLLRLTAAAESPTTTPEHVLQHDSDAVNALVFSPDGRFLYSSGADRQILQWDLTKLFRRAPGVDTKDAMPEVQCRLTGHQSQIWSLALSADNALLAGSDVGGTIMLWDVSTCERVDTVAGQHPWTSTCALLQSQQQANRYLLASIASEQQVQLWQLDRRSGGLQRSLQRTIHMYTVAQDTCTFTPDSKFILSAGADGEIYAWDAVNGGCPEVVATDRVWITKMALNGDGSRIAWGTVDGNLWYADVRSAPHGVDDGAKVTIATPSLLGTHRRALIGLSFHPTGRWLASSGEDRMIHIWDFVAGRLQQTMQEHTDTAWVVSFSPDGKYLASTGRDGVICLWTMTDSDEPTTQPAQLLQKWQAHDMSSRNIAFTPDSQHLVTVSNDLTVPIWDLTGQRQRTLRGHDASVGWLAVNPRRVDGRWTVASADEACRVCIWDVDTGERLHTLHTDDRRILDLAYSPDGKMLVSATMQGSLHCWDPQSGALLRTLEITKPYAGTRISGARGLTESQRVSLLGLGAVA